MNKSIKKEIPTLISPNGKEYTCEDILEYGSVSKFCKAYNLDNTVISKLMNGKAGSSRGWTLKHNKKGCKIYKPFRTEIPTLISPDGKEYESKDILNYGSIHKFCEDKNLNRNSIYGLINGHAKSAYGWTLKIDSYITDEMEDIIIKKIELKKKLSNLKNDSDEKILLEFKLDQLKSDLDKEYKNQLRKLLVRN